VGLSTVARVAALRAKAVFAESLVLAPPRIEMLPSREGLLRLRAGAHGCHVRLSGEKSGRLSLYLPVKVLGAGARFWRRAR
jgi:hypothetical protein